MKWIGQHIYDLISRFRSAVYLEDVDTGTIVSGGNLGLDSDNKIVKATISSGSGDLTAIVAGTGLSGADLTGPIPTLNVDASQTHITAVGTIGTGEWRGTAINQAYLDGQSGTNTGDETSERINDLEISTVGTIDSGEWRATAISTAYQKHLAHFEFEGFSVGDGTNYMIAELNSDTKAPFEHQTSTGSDGQAATGPVRLLKTAGHVMPYAGTLKLWKGWATSSGSTQTVDVGLYKVTLVNNNASNISPVVLKNTSFTSVGNSKALTFAETSFSVAFAAGDILISAIRNGTNNKRCDFASTLVVEWD